MPLLHSPAPMGLFFFATTHCKHLCSASHLKSNSKVSKFAHSLFAKSKSEHIESYLLKYHLLTKTLTELLCVCVSHSVVSNSLQPHGLQPARLPFVHGISQTRILDWVAISFSRGSSWPRDRNQVSCIAGGFFTIWAMSFLNHYLIAHNQIAYVLHCLCMDLCFLFLDS